MGAWANSGKVNEARNQVTPTTSVTANQAKAHQDLLNVNNEKLRQQQLNGDKFENEDMGGGAFFGQIVNAPTLVSDAGAAKQAIENGQDPNKAIYQNHHYTSNTQVFTGKYVVPAIGMGLSGVEAVGGAGVTAVSCNPVTGAETCPTVGALGLKSAISGMDGIFTNYDNFGKNLDEQHVSLGLEEGPLKLTPSQAATVLVINGATDLAAGYGLSRIARTSTIEEGLADTNIAKLNNVVSGVSTEFGP